jgi:predicted DNA-binding protein YlxM (UPF0122 family)
MRCFVSIVDSEGAQLDDARREALVERILRHRRLIGWRRWGMMVLYYRSGLSQNEIAGVFGTNRQTVSYELKRALKMVAGHLDGLRKYGLGGAGE